ncbi:MAG: 5-formyltetrahydrofolate cyclo-ligase [Megasphaera sp.]|jgi:5-formyltetrahydrofolate cyclo-ligase|nr:5-formyltetrahydrofolate cyclo-ligase [Megasphaera sp.]MCH4188618.1 5-formyltetrahydrofolate cyclo-ligase [Megasphaera sp.]MCH4218463.1 5-formyltetrahydrofolate cyclo-ligase [Megasphaera sp.]
MTGDEEKKILRQDVRAAAAALPAAYCLQADAAISRFVRTLPEYIAAKTICCYVGTDSEIDTRAIIAQALQDGKCVGVPLCLRKGMMEMRAITGESDLQEGAYGIKEPKEGTRLLAPTAIDAGLIPCLTCNEKGQRLGYGGGFYDRYLRAANCTRIVLCRKRMMREHIPVGPYDLPMDVVVSEEKIMRIK